METASFERLLYEEESPALDFKSEQYRFIGATDHEKSELLKDILGFANAWRRSEAYILTGVEEVCGGRSNVVGIAPGEHLGDHNLQQFVNNKTNRPLLFQYEAFVFEGKQVGIIRIEVQQRPFFLEQDYGKLTMQSVYVRRGTSTDPTKPATTDEILRMSRSVSESAELEIEFAELDNNRALGTEIAWNAHLLEAPPPEEIPDYRGSHRTVGGVGFSAGLSPGIFVNSEYLRERAFFETFRSLFRPVRLVVRNVGRVAAGDVRCEITIECGQGVVAMESGDFPDEPRRQSSMLHGLAFRKGINLGIGARPGGVSIDKGSEQCRIDLECGSLQPGRSVWSDMFYLGKGKSGIVQLGGEIFAANLPLPRAFALKISGDVVTTTMTVDDLRKLPDLPDQPDDE